MGKTTQVTRKGGIEGFAVDDAHASFAYTTLHLLRHNAPTDVDGGVYTTVLIDLEGGSSRDLVGVWGIVSSCGGLFPMDVPVPEPGPRDLVSGDEVAFHSYSRFLCSADRKTVVGVAKKDGGLFSGDPPAIRIADAKTFNHYGFAISPDGSKVAYRSDRGRLCMFSGSDPARCVEVEATLADAPSVNDSGELLVAMGTGQECFYTGYSSFSPRHVPAATNESRDECLGVGFWSADLGSVQIIGPLGRHPQWIKPETAQLLIKWAQGAASGEPR
jgi:hypothetical protein